MALIECTECKKEISDKALFCPHCGLPFSKSQIISQTNEVIIVGKDTQRNERSFPVLSFYLIYISPLSAILALGSLYGDYTKFRDILNISNPLIINLKIYLLVFNLFNFGMCFYANYVGRNLSNNKMNAIEDTKTYFSFYLFYKLIVFNVMILVLNNSIIINQNMSQLYGSMIGISLRSIIIYGLARRSLSATIVSSK